MIKKDIIIIGAGVGGLFTAYQLRKKNSNISITILDRGNELENRKCFAADGGRCVFCKNCAITNGVAGSGAFSDAKFSIGTSYGGTLANELGEKLAYSYIVKVDEILNSFSEDYPKLYTTDSALKLLCLQNNLSLLDMNLRHLGTDKNFITMQNLIKWLRDNQVEIISNCEVTSVVNEDNQNYSIITTNTGLTFCSDKVVVAPGRGGASFVKKLCADNSIAYESNCVDIGVRVEVNDLVWKHFSSKIYEPKILYKTKTFEDNCRMFCFNQGGIVSAENNNGIITANGHSFADETKKTDNCNFAILSSIKFTEPFNQPTEYAEYISKLANIIGNGNVIIQRFGDLKRGRRTTETRLARNTVKPTLQATPGDLALVLPFRILTNIKETLEALNRVAPGTSGDDTLLYGCESKYYSLKPMHDKTFQIAKNLYLIGDGSGITRGLSQSAAMGLFVADNIIKSY